MTIGKKLTMGFAAVLFAALALAGGYLYSVRSLAGALKTATDITAKKIFLASELQAQLFRMRSCQRGVMLFMLENLPEKAKSNQEEFETRSAGAWSNCSAKSSPCSIKNRAERSRHTRNRAPQLQSLL
jgi:CHASE3 domain sensor protein